MFNKNVKLRGKCNFHAHGLVGGFFINCGVQKIKNELWFVWLVLSGSSRLKKSRQGKRLQCHMSSPVEFGALHVQGNQFKRFSK